VTERSVFDVPASPDVEPLPVEDKEARAQIAALRDDTSLRISDVTNAVLGLVEACELLGNKGERASEQIGRLEAKIAALRGEVLFLIGGQDKLHARLRQVEQMLGIVSAVSANAES